MHTMALSSGWTTRSALLAVLCILNSLTIAIAHPASSSLRTSISIAPRFSPHLTARAAQGASCSSGAQSDSGICDDRTCTSVVGLAAEGECDPRLDGKDCNSGYCNYLNGLCFPSNRGSPCRRMDDQCRSGVCVDSVCTLTRASSAQCSTSCSIGTCDAGVCRLLRLGATCRNSGECDSSACTGGVCTLLPDGARCMYNARCASGWCVDISKEQDGPSAPRPHSAPAATPIVSAARRNVRPGGKPVSSTPSASAFPVPLEKHAQRGQTARTGPGASTDAVAAHRGRDAPPTRHAPATRASTVAARPSSMAVLASMMTTVALVAAPTSKFHRGHPGPLLQRGHLRH
ncbi:hypothetical protein V8E36_008808 [Tilletia maclaganii]